MKTDWIKEFSEERKKIKPKLEFYRTAANSKFADVFFDAIAGEKPESKWLNRLDYENNKSYKRRAKTAKDFGWSKRVIDTYKGFFFNANIDIKIEGSNEIVEQFRNNIDNEGTNLKEFISRIIDESLTMGCADIITDSKPELYPYPWSYIIKQEQIQDTSRDKKGNDFDLYRYCAKHEKVINFQKRKVLKYYVWTDDIILIGRINKLNKIEIEQIENGLGYVPIRRMDVSRIPIIAPIAPIQLDQMNLFSEIRNILSQQAIAILHMPKSAYDAMEFLTTDTILIYGDNYQGPIPGWLPYPANSLDGHFNYNKVLTEFIYELSNLRKKDTKAQESAESKKIDFLNPRTLLNILADQIEQVIPKIAEDWNNYTGQTLTVEINIDRESFDLSGLTEKLNDIITAMTIGFGEIAEQELLKRNVDNLLPNLSYEKKQEILKQIDERSDKIKLDRITMNEEINE